MRRTHGPDVFGSHESVEEIKGQLASSRDLLVVDGPTIPLDEFGERDEDIKAEG
ncbi:hypothetical protein GFY24_40390 [Nocardia sp. SYP-A9097]|uniref:hypothetical protein n=1 Tax=Nocardia sp. SYP-A9097 TaxID=2663237 RepID=UPI00129A0D6A|nr:hypothetical protein [Nocardia sp. SYP-A9097]MRH93583.1 hypothetical protein [Nocardia sp. SYP-A9097]